MKTLNTGLLYSLAGVTLLGSVQGCKEQKETPRKRYNIVYIMSDDHTQQIMSCYDQRYMQTPNMDRIAKDGVKFVNSFVANSISGPSRACMLTGKHTSANRFYDNTTCVFDSAQQTLPKILRHNGYQTALIGKWHLGGIPTGYDYWEILPGQGDYYNPVFIQQNQEKVQFEGYVTNLITDKAIDWLDHRDTTKPFYLQIHHKAVHRNWMSDTTHLSLYEDVTFPIPENFYDAYEGRPAAAAQEMSIDKDMDLIYDLKMMCNGKSSPYAPYYTGIIGRMNPAQRAAWDKVYEPIIADFYARDLKGKELAEWKYQRYMRDYMKTVKSLDENIGRVLDYLEEHGLSENTLIVYTSDQGFYMGEHGWFDKRFMYEESMRTPLVMKLPKGLNAKGDIPQLVQNIDYAPTFLDMVGIAVPEDMHGESMLPLLTGEPVKSWRKSLYYHYYEFPAEHMVKRHYGVRTERYKLIHFYNDINHWELYDLQEDPTEMHNIYDNPEHADLIEGLKKEIVRLQEKYNNPIRFGLDKDKD